MADLIQKFSLRAGQLICLLDPTEEAGQTLLSILPPGVTVHSTLHTERYDVILAWPRRLEGMEDWFRLLQAHLKPDGAIWAMMPKARFARRRGIDFTWEQLQKAGLTTDLVDNKIASLNEQDYGTRFVIRVSRRARAG